MKRSMRDDKNAAESEQESQASEDYQKDRRIKRLTQINKELIDTLKQQNEELTKKIEKQKIKPGRSISLRSTPKQTKELQSIRKQLSNAYRQIDMYKQVIQNLRAKDISLDHVDKINQLQNKVKNEDAIIDNYQKQIKYYTALKEKQEKELKVFQNQQVKQSKVMLEKEIAAMKDKLKNIKKNAAKRNQIEKRQHAYFVELEKTVRKINDQYYPGKEEPKKEVKEDEEISQMEWATVKSKLSELRRLYNENNKKLDNINRQKLKELKSYEENELKLKEKMRKLNTLKSRISELTKLTIAKEKPKEPKVDLLPKREEIKNDKNKVTTDDREVKKWNVPTSYNLQKGKVLPNSFFSSDKTLLDSQHRYKMVEVNAYVNGSGVPCLLSFVYENEQGEHIPGRDMIELIPNALELKSFQLKDKDYIWQISGSLKNGLLNSISFKSKLGRQTTFEDENSNNSGDSFSFQPKQNEIPTCFYGATLQMTPTSEQVKICYLGFEFMSDW